MSPGPSPAHGVPGPATSARPLVPGELDLGLAPVVLGTDPVAVVTVLNAGDRPVQVGSHYHFAEVNDALLFDRAAAWGRRLAVPAGTAVRFEPGIERSVGLVALAGRRVVWGLRAMTAGALDAPVTDGDGSEEGSP